MYGGFMNICPLGITKSEKSVFNAKFVRDEEGKLDEVLNNPSYNREITQKTMRLANELRELGKGQDLVVLKQCEYDDSLNHKRGLLILNTTTQKVAPFCGNSEKPFWDGVLSALLRRKDFYEVEKPTGDDLHKLLLNG